MSETDKDKRHDYILKKLKDSYSYNNGQKMLVLLQKKLDFGDRQKEQQLHLHFLPDENDDSENQIKRWYKWKKKICESQNNTCNTVAKIIKMYTDTAKKEFLSKKNSRQQTRKKI